MNMRLHPSSLSGKCARGLVVSAAALIVCTIISCGGHSRDIVGKWRTSGDTNAMVWEFSKNGALQIGSDRGRYTFGDSNRIKIQTGFAPSVYQLEISGDHMTLKAPNGSKLEFTRIQEKKD